METRFPQGFPCPQSLTQTCFFRIFSDGWRTHHATLFFPVHRWDEAAKPDEHWVQNVVTAVLSEELADPRALSPKQEVVLHYDNTFRVKVELVADGYGIASERFYLNQAVKAATLVKAVVQSFAGCLKEVHGVLCERMNNAPVQDVVLHEDLPEVTKFEYQVQWSDLVQRNGLDKLLGLFDVPDPLAKSQAVEGRNKTVTVSFEGDGHITGDGLSQVIASGFRRVKLLKLLM